MPLASTSEVIKKMLVTIGPQCAGKSTYISSLGKVVDIAMDDMPGTYQQLPVEEMLSYHESGELTPSLCRVVYQQPLYQHIDEPAASEQMSILLYFAEQISIEELHAHVLEIGMVQEDAQLLCASVQELFDLNYRVVTPTVDIFVPGAMGYSVRLAQDSLEDVAACPAHDYVSWGNTNIGSKMYKSALQVAFKTRRAVSFIKWGYELPAVDGAELYRRNILRFIFTGRYIPLAVSRAFLHRVTSFFLQAMEFSVPDRLLVGRRERGVGEGDGKDDSHSKGKYSSHEMDAVLAYMAGFEMDADGLVTPLPVQQKQRGRPNNSRKGGGRQESGKPGRDYRHVADGSGQSGGSLGGRREPHKYEQGKKDCV